MSKILTEVTPLSEHDCFYLVDRVKRGFDYPIHKHREMEMNFVFNCEGCQRIVGDSIEEIGYHDLVIIEGGLEHGWLQNGVEKEDNMREITVQWDPESTNGRLLEKNQFTSLREMFQKAKHGLAFGPKAIATVLPKFEELVQPQAGFMRYVKLIEIFYLLSISADYRSLSTTSFAKVGESDNSRRVSKIKNYISENYAEPLRLEDLAGMVGMTPTAFSRFFKTHTNQTLSDYIIDIRLGHAIRNLIDTNMTCSEICYTCGFNNLSNFNRLFKKKKGCTPLEFRDKYIKTRIIV